MVVLSPAAPSSGNLKTSKGKNKSFFTHVRSPVEQPVLGDWGEAVCGPGDVVLVGAVPDTLAQEAGRTGVA